MFSGNYVASPFVLNEKASSDSLVNLFSCPPILKAIQYLNFICAHFFHYGMNHFKAHYVPAKYFKVLAQCREPYQQYTKPKKVSFKIHLSPQIGPSVRQI